MFNFKIANARYINVHRGSRLSFFASCLCPFKRDDGTTGTLIASLSITNGTILMHDESAILSTININPPFILFFVSVRREAR